MMATVETIPARKMVAMSEDLAAAALALARRFAAGATMWCVSPEWPSHGGHVAVEFVHPVIVGKRALAAVHVEGPDPVAAVRLLARTGDVLLAVSGPDDPLTLDLLRRAEAWGLTRLWLGAGSRPPTGRAEHVVWSDHLEPARAARSGDMVLLYHLLWELTHVVFEHPGLLAAADPECGDDVCITCFDQGDVAEVRDVLPAGRARVVARGLPQDVDVNLIDPVAPGDLVLIHAGVAITALGEPSP
jgi:hydrogenase maturation factor